MNKNPQVLRRKAPLWTSPSNFPSPYKNNHKNIQGPLIPSLTKDYSVVSRCFAFDYLGRIMGSYSQRERKRSLRVTSRPLWSQGGLFYRFFQRIYWKIDWWAGESENLMVETKEATFSVWQVYTDFVHTKPIWKDFTLFNYLKCTFFPLRPTCFLFSILNLTCRKQVTLSHVLCDSPQKIH